jgi:hypothetical protein
MEEEEQGDEEAKKRSLVRRTESINSFPQKSLSSGITVKMMPRRRRRIAASFYAATKNGSGH